MSITHEDLYKQLRANVLARHFALGRYWRANHFTNENFLGEAPPTLPPHGETATVKCWVEWSAPRRKVGGQETSLYESAEEIRDRPDLVLERWRVMRHDRTNALLMTGLRLISLCVEHRLGHPDARRLIQLTLGTVASLFKFTEPATPFAGYILRWDPATTDEWSVEIDAKGNETPQVCCQFLVNQDAKSFHKSHFLYCTPLQDPRYERAVREGVKDRFRRWEPSMDEYVGLMAGYALLFQTFKDDRGAEGQQIIAEVRRQVALVGRYLQHVGYLLVRPCGGFTTRGAAGPNPCYEYPFSRVFRRITGEAFAVPGTATFDEAIRQANLSACWRRSQVLSLPQALQRLRDSPAWPALVALFGPDPKAVWEQYLGDVAEVILGAAHVLLNLDCLDISHDEDRSEFVVASILKQICLGSPQKGFELFMRNPPKQDNWSDYHKPLLGLTALDDDDPVVRDEYLRWFDAFLMPRMNGPDQDEVLGTQQWSLTALATAVAVLLRADDPIRRAPLERRLALELGRMRDTLEATCKGDLVLTTVDNAPGRSFRTVSETHDKRGNWFGYLAPLSLAWLHQLRLGQRVFRTIPTPAAASVQSWPPAVVPGVAIRAAYTDRLPIPVRALVRGFVPDEHSGDVDLFKDPPAKPHDNAIGEIPAPVPGPTHTLNHVAFPLVWPPRREFRLPLPPALDPRLNRADFACVPTWHRLEERNVRQRTEREESDAYVITVEFETLVRTERFPFVQLQTGLFEAECTLSWTRVV